MVCARATVVLARRPVGLGAQARRTMRKQTAPQIRDNREASSRKQSGLIAQDVSAQQSAMSKSVLDNRSHRARNYAGSGERGAVTDGANPASVSAPQRTAPRSPLPAPVSLVHHRLRPR